MHLDDPAFWRSGAISTVTIMSIALVVLTVNSLAAITPGSSHVPLYTVINKHVAYEFNAKRGEDVPVIGGSQPLFDKTYDAEQAKALIAKSKKQRLGIHVDLAAG